MTIEVKEEVWNSLLRRLTALEGGVVVPSEVHLPEIAAQSEEPPEQSHQTPTQDLLSSQNACQSEEQLNDSLVTMIDMRIRVAQQRQEIDRHNVLLAEQARQLERLNGAPQASPSAKQVPHSDNLALQHVQSLETLDASMELLGEKMTKLENLQEHLEGLRSDLEAEGDLRRRSLEGLEKTLMALDKRIDKNIALVEPVKAQYAQVTADIADLQQSANVESQLADIKQAADLATFEVKKIEKIQKKVDDVGKKVSDVEGKSTGNNERFKLLDQRIGVVEEKQSSLALSLTFHRESFDTHVQGFEALRQQLTQLSGQFVSMSALHDDNTSRAIAPVADGDINFTNAANEERTTVTDRLIALEGLGCSNRLDVAERAIALLQSTFDEAGQRSKDRDANTSERIESIGRQLRTIDDIAANKVSAVEYRVADLERQVRPGSHTAGQGLRGTVGIMMEGFATRLDRVDEELGRISVVSQQHAVSERNLGPQDSSGQDSAKDANGGDLDVERLREQYGADLKWLEQQSHALSNQLELEILERKEADAKILMNIHKAHLEAVLHFDTLWDFLDNKRMTKRKREDARQQWKARHSAFRGVHLSQLTVQQEERDSIRWWAKQMVAAKTKEGLDPVMLALDALKHGRAVPDPYAKYTNFPLAAERLAHLLKAVRSGLPPAQKRAMVDSHRLTLEQSSSQTREDSNLPASPPEIATDTRSSATAGSNKRKAKANVKEETNTKASSEPHQKRIRGDSAAASAASFRPSNSPE